MFERFTEDARQVVSEAQHSARLLRHPHIGTDHLLLGLAADAKIALWLSDVLGLTRDTLMADVVRICGRGDATVLTDLPYSPSAKTVLQRALREALGAGHNYIAPIHILLGLVWDNKGVAARILYDYAAHRHIVLGEEARHLLPEPGRWSETSLKNAERALARKSEAEADAPTVDFDRLTLEEAEQLVDLLRKGAGEPTA